MKFWLFKVLPAIFLLLVFMPVFGQTQPDTTKIYQVETIDKNIFQGKISEQDSEKLLLKTEKFGTMTIFRKDIKKITEIEPSRLREGKYWFENPQSTRYFFSPNGYGLKKNEGYYQNIWVLWNNVSYGVTDQISVGGGMVPLFFFGGPTPLWFTPKISIPIKKDKFNIGAGALTG
jgi:hypothetical protein